MREGCTDHRIRHDPDLRFVGFSNPFVDGSRSPIHSLMGRGRGIVCLSVARSLSLSVTRSCSRSLALRLSLSLCVSLCLNVPLVGSFLPPYFPRSLGSNPPLPPANSRNPPDFHSPHILATCIHGCYRTCCYHRPRSRPSWPRLPTTRCPSPTPHWQPSLPQPAGLAPPPHPQTRPSSSTSLRSAPRLRRRQRALRRLARRGRGL